MRALEPGLVSALVPPLSRLFRLFITVASSPHLCKASAARTAGIASVATA